MRTSLNPFLRSDCAVALLVAFVAPTRAADAPAVDRVLPAVVKVKARTNAGHWAARFETSARNCARCHKPVSANDWLVILSDGTRSKVDNLLFAHLDAAAGSDLKAEARLAEAKKKLEAAKKKGRAARAAAQKQYDTARRALDAVNATNLRRWFLDTRGVLPTAAEVAVLERNPSPNAREVETFLGKTMVWDEARLHANRSNSDWVASIVRGSSESEGTGFVWRDGGYLVTASTVVGDANQFEVTLPSGKSLEAKLVGSDALTGVAVLKVDAKELASVTTSGAALRPGESIFAVGNTEGFVNTVLPGIVSGLDRTLELSGQRMDRLIQTNIVLPTGFAGGPLVNAHGEVVGVNFATYTPGAEGAAPMFSFALPIDDVRRVAEEIIQHGGVQRAFLGVRVSDLDDAQRALLKLGKQQGVMIEAVFENSPAAKAGIAAGDLLMKLDERDIARPSDLPQLLRDRKPGERVIVELFRGGKPQRLEIIGGAPPKELVEAKKPSDRFDDLLQELLKSKRSDEQILEALYLAMLSRLPTEAERKAGRDQLSQLMKQKERAQAFADFLFALRHSREFQEHLDALKPRDPRRSSNSTADTPLVTLGGPKVRVPTLEELSPRIVTLGGPKVRVPTLEELTPRVVTREGPTRSGVSLLGNLPLVGKLFNSAPQTTATSLHTLTGHSGIVLGAAFAPDGKTIATTGFDTTVRLWDAASGRAIHQLSGHGGTVFTVAFSPDGSRLASGGVDRLRLWDTASGLPLHHLSGQGSAVRALAFSPDGKLLASGSDDKSIWVYEVQTGAPRLTLSEHAGTVMALAFSPDGKWLASGGVDRTVRVRDTTIGAALTTIAVTQPVRALAFLNDGRSLVIVGDDRSVRLWDLEANALLWKSESHTGAVIAVAVSSDHRSIVSAGYDRTIRVWDARTGKLLRVLGNDTDRISALAFSPDGRRLIVGSPDGSVRLLDLSGGM